MAYGGGRGKVNFEGCVTGKEVVVRAGGVGREAGGEGRERGKVGEPKGWRPTASRRPPSAVLQAGEAEPERQARAKGPGAKRRRERAPSQGKTGPAK